MMFRTLSTLLIALVFGLFPLTAIAEKNPEADARRLVNALGCKGCHKLEGDGGSLAPELDHIGSRMTRDQINQHLAAHADSRQKGFMPSYNTTSQAELTLLSNFLYNLQ